MFRRILHSGISKSALVALVKAIIEKYEVHILSPESYMLNFRGSQLWVYLPHTLRIQYDTGSPEPHLNSLSFDFESVLFSIWFNAGLSQIQIMTFVGIGLNQVPRSKGGLYVQKRKRKKIANLKH